MLSQQYSWVRFLDQSYLRLYIRVKTRLNLSKFDLERSVSRASAEWSAKVERDIFVKFCIKLHVRPCIKSNDFQISLLHLSTRLGSFNSNTWFVYKIRMKTALKVTLKSLSRTGSFVWNDRTGGLKNKSRNLKIGDYVKSYCK